jgi:hypothetical protein
MDEKIVTIGFIGIIIGIIKLNDNIRNINPVTIKNSLVLKFTI